MDEEYEGLDSHNDPDCPNSPHEWCYYCANQITKKRDQRIAELEHVLRMVDEWDLNWADGLDSNVERIKTEVRHALEGD